MTTFQWKVVGQRTMHCSGCEHSVTFSLKAIDGVETVKADRQNQQIQVTAADNPSVKEKIVQELEWLGYDVQEVRE